MRGRKRTPTDRRGNRGGVCVLDPAYRDQVLINEGRTELKGSIVAWIGLVLGTGFLAFEFAGRADRLGFFLWLGAISAFLGGWFVAWARFALRPPNDRQ